MTLGEFMKEQGDPLACPVCASRVGTSGLPRVYVAPFNAQEYTLQRCGNCELGFWTPLQIAPAFYESEGFTVIERGFEPHWKLDDVKYGWSAHASGGA